MVDYAIIQTGGKQYRVQEGDSIRVESLPVEAGDALDLEEVLLVSKGGSLKVGNPTVPGARVKTEVKGHGRGPKVIIFKFKAKTRYRRKTGHRQGYTELAIRDILVEE
ncbi:MAG: 50S ribosomal protein L21 [Chloroflexi bacterium]|nr:50S ribosomal protein L21 [Chloroflexota bacterium]